MKKERVLEFVKVTIINHGVTYRDHMGELLGYFIEKVRTGTGLPYDGNENSENFEDAESEDELIE